MMESILTGVQTMRNFPDFSKSEQSDNETIRESEQVIGRLPLNHLD